MHIGAGSAGAGEGTGDFVDQYGTSNATTATETAFFERCTVIAHDGHFDMKAIGLGHFLCESKVQQVTSVALYHQETASLARD
jgi:hypothetical protein